MLKIQNLRGLHFDAKKFGVVNLQRSFPFSIKTRAMSAISDAIKEDHRKIGTYYKSILEAPDNEAATRWQNQFTWELARHSIAEELVVYPAFEKNLGSQGKQMAEKDRSEHQIVKEKLYKFQALQAGSPEFIPTLESLMGDLQTHINEEEGHDLPALDTALDAADAEALAKSFERTKAFVPSRSHPSAPNRPPFETVAGLMAAPLDHLGDLLRRFPDETASPNPSKE